jgi:hypothetical protein
VFVAFPRWRQRLGVNCVTAAVEIPWGAEYPMTTRIVRPDGMFRRDVNLPFYAPVRLKP